jgi:diguanylate cyclase (GGDEF)-like protein
MHQSLYRWELDTDVLLWGATTHASLGFHPPATARAFEDLLTLETARLRRDVIQHSDLEDEGAGVPYQFQCRLKDGLYIEEIGRWFADSTGRPAVAHGLMRRSSADYVLQKSWLIRPHDCRHSDLADHDRVIAHLEQTARSLEGSARGIALLLVRIENLGLLNRNYGDAIAEEVMRAVARTLRHHSRLGDVFGEYATGTFALGLRGGDHAQMAQRAHQILRTGREVMVDTSYGTVPIDLRIGGSVLHNDVATLIQQADTALMIARTSRTKSFMAYGDALARHYDEIVEQTKTTHVMQALQTQAVGLMLQPLVQEGDGLAHVFLATLGSLEKGGARLALPKYERLGLQRLLDQRLLDLACQYLAEHTDKHLCVPLDDAMLRQRGFVANLAHVLAEMPEIADRLTIAVSEFSLAKSSAAMRRVMRGLKTLGLKCALREFGAGYAHATLLLQLAPDLVFIDAALSQNIGRDADARFVMRSLIDDLTALGLRTAATGVDTVDDARRLAEWGIAYQAGAWFGPALPEVTRHLSPQADTAVA